LHRILLIAKRDYLATVRTKAFVISLVVAPVLFGGGSLFVGVFLSKPETGNRRIAVIDHTGVAAQAVVRVARERNERELFDKKTGTQVTSRYDFELVEPDDANPGAQRLALSDRVRRRDLFAFIEIRRDTVHPGKDAAAGRVAYYTNSPGLDEVRRWLADSINEGIRRVRLAELGVDASHFDEISAYVPMVRMDLISRDQKTGRIQPARRNSELSSVAAPLTLVLLLGMIVMLGAAPMLSSVTEDKTQRVVEMLLGMATPMDLMSGKVLAAIGVSLTSSAFYVVGGTVTLQGMGMAGLVPFGLLPWFYVYLVAEVTMLCALAAGLGAACSTPQEAGNLTTLLISPVIVSYFFMMPVLRQPNSGVATAMSLLPPCTPVLMLLRQAMPGGVPPWQPWVGLVGVLSFTAAAAWLAGRIFRVAILLQGKPPKLTDLVRWAVRG